MTIPLSHPFPWLWEIHLHATPSRLLLLGFSRELLHQLVLFLPLSPLLGLAWILLMTTSCLSTRCSRLPAPFGLPPPVDALRCHLCPLRPGFSWSLHRRYTTTNLINLGRRNHNVQGVARLSICYLRVLPPIMGGPIRMMMWTTLMFLPLSSPLLSVILHPHPPLHYRLHFRLLALWLRPSPLHCHCVSLRRTNWRVLLSRTLPPI